MKFRREAIYLTQLSLLLLIYLVDGYSSKKAPRFEGLTDEGFHGIVSENERLVIVKPRIKIIDAKACNIEIANKHRSEVPFEVKLLDDESGEAIIEAKRELNCENRRLYKFSIRAIGCNKLHSQNATVRVTVEDVNEYSPIFRQDQYRVTVNEGRLINPIIRVEALDSDCSSKFSQICKYEIEDEKASLPFDIDAHGNIRNTRPLSWKETNEYTLKVIAYDCGMKRSQPAIVNITVNRVCQLGWKEIPERIEYVPGSGQRILFPDAELQLCDVPCEPDYVSLRLSLATHHIGKGCDRDTYSVESQRKICGASDESIDLLPSPGIGTEWTKDLPTDEGHDSDQIYEFDGSTNAVVIPEATLNHNLTDKFTIAFWMKHEQPLDHNNKHIKEHIICNADEHQKSRHHYALFVRNCRLILLIRREFNQEKHNIFKPAEWRWKISEVCDNEWHHYAVNINFPDVDLYIDGTHFHYTSTNPEIVDDWPLHKIKEMNTTFVVGACWDGKLSKMNFHFRGFLAGLSILRGKTELPEVLLCLHRCKEGLELPPSDTLDPGTTLSIISDSTEVMVESKDAIDVEDVVSQITYVNSREFPTPGRRNIRITTSIKCNHRRSLKIPPVDAYIMVLPPEQPRITLNGTPNLAREYEAFIQGIELFSTVSILVNHETESNEDDTYEDKLQETTTASTLSASASFNGHKLDRCMVQVYPPLNPDHEYFRLPANFMAHLGVRFKETLEGIIVYGADTVRNYQLILRRIIYFNRKPAYYLNRAFKLTCSELNGRFVSNDYIQTLTVIHPKSDINNNIIDNNNNINLNNINNNNQAGQQQKSMLNNIDHLNGHQSVAHVQIHKNNVEFKKSQVKNVPVNLLDNGMLDNGDNFGKASANTRLSPIVVGHAVTVIIVVCVGFLLFMIVLGVIRIRAAHRRSTDTRDEEQEMTWDDTSLTITVNPLEQIGRDHENQPLHEDDDDSDSSDDGSSYHEDGETSEDETEKAKARRELEWDDSTLNF